MAATHVIKIADGNNSRSAVSVVSFDAVDSNGIGSTLGLTIATDLATVAVDASTAELYTSAAVLDNLNFMQAACEYLDGVLDGARVWFSQNSFDQFTVHVRGEIEVADNVDISVPVISVV